MRSLTFFPLALCLVFASQSAVAGTAKWGPDTMNQLTKGESQGDVEALLGEPASHRTALGGSEEWIYRKPAAGQRAVNLWAAFDTWGMQSGANAPKVDVLTVTFRGGVVTDASYEANVDNIATSRH